LEHALQAVVSTGVVAVHRPGEEPRWSVRPSLDER
jgi:hypothetical protein